MSSDWGDFAKIFNNACEQRGSIYRVGYALDNDDPCVLQGGDSVVCRVSQYDSNAMQKIMRICLALEAREPKGI